MLRIYIFPMLTMATVLTAMTANAQGSTSSAGHLSRVRSFWYGQLQEIHFCNVANKQAEKNRNHLTLWLTSKKNNTIPVWLTGTPGLGLFQGFRLPKTPMAGWISFQVRFFSSNWNLFLAVVHVVWNGNRSNTRSLLITYTWTNR